MYVAYWNFDIGRQKTNSLAIYRSGQGLELRHQTSKY